MYELINAAGNTYYIDCPSKVGVWVSGTDVWLIDSGNNKEAARKILKAVREQGWEVKAIINTHSHADHCGGNQFIAERTACDIYAPFLESLIVNEPLLEPALLYGGNPPKQLRNKFLMAQPSDAKPLSADVLPEGFEIADLRGHSWDMVGIKTPDGVWFVGDSLFGEETLEKYHVSYLTDPVAFLESLEALEKLDGECFIPSHSPVLKDVKDLTAKNRAKTLEIMGVIENACLEPKDSEEIIKAVFDHYSLTLTFEQHALVGSTVRSYITSLYDGGKLGAVIEDNRLLWKKAGDE